MVFFIVTIIIAGMYIPIDKCWSDEFVGYSFPGKVFYYMLAGLGKRFFYYSPFTATTGAIVASGFGYNGMKKSDDKGAKEEHTWDKIVGVYWMECETILSPIEIFRYWNYQVHIWMKRYVAHRLTPEGERAGPYDFAIVFMTSAFWHGFYYAYYIAFFFSAINCEIAKDIYKARNLFNFIPYPIRIATANIVTFMALNYHFVVINALTF